MSGNVINEWAYLACQGPWDILLGEFNSSIFFRVIFANGSGLIGDLL